MINVFPMCFLLFMGVEIFHSINNILMYLDMFHVSKQCFKNKKAGNIL